MTPRGKNKVLSESMRGWSNRHYQFALDQEAEKLFIEYTQQLIGAHKFGGMAGCETKVKDIFDEMQKIALSDTAWAEAPATLDLFRFKLDGVYAGYLLKLEESLAFSLKELHQTHQLVEIKNAVGNCTALMLSGIPSKITRREEVENAYLNDNKRHVEQENNEPKPNLGRSK